MLSFELDVCASCKVEKSDERSGLQKLKTYNSKLTTQNFFSYSIQRSFMIVGVACNRHRGEPLGSTQQQQE